MAVLELKVNAAVANPLTRDRIKGRRFETANRELIAGFVCAYAEVFCVSDSSFLESNFATGT